MTQQQTMNNRMQTPLERLIADKNRVKALCEEQGKVLNDDINYVQANVGKLLLSSLSSVLFPTSAGKNKTSSDVVESSGDSFPISLIEMLPLAKSLLPIAWDIVKPILISWGIKRVSNLVLQVLSKKKA